MGQGFALELGFEVDFVFINICQGRRRDDKGRGGSQWLHNSFLTPSCAMSHDISTLNTGNPKDNTGEPKHKIVVTSEGVCF